MPTDQKRINGPEVTIPYHIYAEREKKEEDEQDFSTRLDGRTKDEFRKMYLKTGVVSQAKGSAYVEMGDTKIHQQDTEEKQYSLVLQRALEPAVCLHEFPNFQVDVYAMVLDNGGSSLAAAIMAASIALANAGVPMFGLVTASTVGILGDSYLLDPTDTEEAYCYKTRCTEGYCHGTLMQANLPQHGQISEVFLSGSANLNLISDVMELLARTNREVCPVLQRCLVKSVMKLVQS
ncbi:hypothetical protein KM043_013852 [Ampulex compressa]|nr:hypothetical protein KM043_013852 [Ampulex compressa]